MKSGTALAGPRPLRRNQRLRATARNPKPGARDYVIKAFNDNKPYDCFIKEQLADELPDADAESITATVFHRLGIWDDEPADRPLAP